MKDGLSISARTTASIIWEKLVLSTNSHVASIHTIHDKSRLHSNVITTITDARKAMVSLNAVFRTQATMHAIANMTGTNRRRMHKRP